MLSSVSTSLLALLPLASSSLSAIFSRFLDSFCDGVDGRDVFFGDKAESLGEAAEGLGEDRGFEAGKDTDGGLALESAALLVVVESLLPSRGATAAPRDPFDALASLLLLLLLLVTSGLGRGRASGSCCCGAGDGAWAEGAGDSGRPGGLLLLLEGVETAAAQVPCFSPGLSPSFWLSEVEEGF